MTNHLLPLICNTLGPAPGTISHPKIPTCQSHWSDQVYTL